jgi:hypothetical protein
MRSSSTVIVPRSGGCADDGLDLEREVAFCIPGLRPVSLQVEMTAEEFELLQPMKLKRSC